jgi:ribosome-binding ATPase YchF (GTP1/OBG family)
MKRAITLAKINHPWNWYNMRMLRSWPTKIPNMNKMRQKTSCVHKMCERTYGQTNMKRAITLAKINHREIGIICAYSDHGQPRYQIWIKCDKRQMTSYVHKMCERTYGQTNMKRAITLAKINHPWNRYTMHMLRSWPPKIPNMNKMRQKTSCVHKMCGRTYGQTNMKRAITRKNQQSVKSV